jgi:hypothetical protein
VAEEQTQSTETDGDTSAVNPFVQTSEGTEAQTESGLSSDLTSSAKEHYGFTDEQLGSFQNDDALSEALLKYDQQVLQSAQQAQPSPFPANPAQQQQQPPVPYEQQPQYQQQPPQQQQPSVPQIPEFPELDPDMMDDTQYKALTALQGQYQQMNTMLTQMNDQWQAYETQNYVSQFQPSIDKLNDGRFGEQNPNYAHNMYQLLDTVERLNEGRQSRGLPTLPTEEAVNAAYRNFQQINGSGLGLPNPLIGQPDTTRHVDSPGDSKALRTIERHGFGGGVDTADMMSGFPE